MKNGDRSVHPTFDKVLDYVVGQGLKIQGMELKESGLTKRELFAMSAMHGILSNPSRADLISNVATDAIIYADELLKQLDKK
jgi:hypothetical protein